MNTNEGLWSLLWPENELGQILNIVILLLLFISIIFGSKHIRRYYLVEIINLNYVINRLKTWREEEGKPEKENVEQTEDTPLHSHSTQLPLADIDELKEGINSKTLIFERLDAIQKMRAHQVKVNLNTLQQMTLAREEASFGLAIPSFVANMAMMLGILGTFWGLAIMVQEISLEMPNSAKLDITSWKQAIDNIGAVLAGMKTAFSTSLVGMFCAVISSSINFGIQKIQANFLQKMEKFTTEDLLPATVPVVEDETLLEQVNQQLSESFNSLNDIFDKNNNTIEELNAVEQAFGDIIKEIRGITRTEASRDLDQIIEKLSDANGTIVALVGHLPQVVSAIENTNNRIDNIARIQKNSLLLNASPKAVLLFVGGVVIVFNLIILIAFLV